jgi:hypothetical protein
LISEELLFTYFVLKQKVKNIKRKFMLYILHRLVHLETMRSQQKIENEYSNTH